MAGSFSQQLEDLLNPQPKFADPEDDGDETSAARAMEAFTEEDEDGEEVGLSVLRRSNTALLSDTDRRYVGKAVSRKDLMDTGMSEEEDDDDEEEEEEDEEEEDDDDDDDEEEEEEEEEEDDEGEEEEDEEEEEEEEEEGIDAQRDTKLSSKTDSCDVSFPQGVDFHRLTEGMDDLGVSEDEEDSDDEGSDDDDDDDDEGESAGDEDEDDDEGTIRTFSKDKVDEEVEKGLAVKNQLALWDQLLEGRIKAQKVLVTVNKLPQPHTFPEFRSRGGAELAGALKNTHKALKALQRSLLELHDQLLHQNADTRTIATGGKAAQSEEEIDSDEDGEGSVQQRNAPKRKLDMAEYPDFMAKRFAAFQPYRDGLLQKWHDRTRLSTGKSSRGFGAFDRNILTQVEQVLMDKERLVRRTQTRRSEYTVLGKTSSETTVLPEGEEEAEPPSKANTHLKDVDKDIFDDDDFYHQLLRELIERRTSTADPNDQVAMGRQWLAIQKLRSKVKKKVDTKASKGRKVRFHVHSKLANFMAPMDHSSMSHEARSELYRGLFGQRSSVRE